MNDKVNVGVLDHVAIHTRQIDATIRFYEKILGLTCGQRAQFNVPGAWLYSEERAIVHLVDTAKSTEHLPNDTGVLHHVAFFACGFEAARRHISRQSLWFDARENTADGVKRIFVRDPNGVLLELNYRSP